VDAAKAFALEMYGGGITDIRLEEIYLDSDDETDWKVTLSWIEPKTVQGKLAAVLTKEGQREYKVFDISRSDGKVRSMRIRKV